MSCNCIINSIQIDLLEKSLILDSKEELNFNLIKALSNLVEMFHYMNNINNEKENDNLYWKQIQPEKINSYLKVLTMKTYFYFLKSKVKIYVY